MDWHPVRLKKVISFIINETFVKAQEAQIPHWWAFISFDEQKKRETKWNAMCARLAKAVAEDYLTTPGKAESWMGLT